MDEYEDVYNEGKYDLALRVQSCFGRATYPTDASSAFHVLHRIARLLSLEIAPSDLSPSLKSHFAVAIETLPKP